MSLSMLNIIKLSSVRQSCAAVMAELQKGMEIVMAGNSGAGGGVIIPGS